MKSKSGNKIVQIVTLGCSKNLVDSELLAKQVEAGNMQVIHDSHPEKADTVIINTCGFIHDAKEESVNTILQFAGAKEKGIIRNLYVTGCLSQRYKEDLRREIPAVDDFFGVDELKNILNRLDIDYKRELMGERLLSTPPHYAYLKISEGCDRQCAFCVIPLIRGNHISKPIEELVSESEILAANGVRELILIAQDLSYYGLDLYKKQRLKELLLQLSLVDGIEWIRLHYAFPARFPMDILPVIRDTEKICAYLDLPLQHISENILRLMRRGISKKETIELIRNIRQNVPGIALRTTLLVGHPGESEEDFRELEIFAEEQKFERMGVFTYSHEEDTYGFRHFDDDIPDEMKIVRKNRLMAIQQEISEKLNYKKIGDSMKVILDRVEGDYFIARTEYDSPEVDNEVLIKREGTELKTGEFYRVKITGAAEFDLYGVVV